MSKKTALKQSRLTGFVTSKSNEVPSTSGIRRNHQIIMNMLVNVNLKYRNGTKDAKTICVVSAIPESQTNSNSIISGAYSSTLATGAIDSTTLNVNVTLNVTTDQEAIGNRSIHIFVDSFYCELLNSFKFI